VIREILGIGPLEIILILVLALIIFGPKEIDNAGKTIGKNLN
jgi:Sec-independent protein translocase protein TatA